MDKHNVKNFSFDAFVGKHAKNQFKLWHFSREWRAGIIIVSVLKFITWSISIYAGYYFLYSISLPVIGNKIAAIIASIVLLVLLELFTWFFLSKFFKFLYKGILATAVFSGIVAISIYYLSFHMSTNGLAMRQADKVNQTETIVKSTDLEIETEIYKYDARIKDYHNEIVSIKANPAGWINGKPTRLTAEQLRDIKEFNHKIDNLELQKKSAISEIENEQKAKLQLNEQETTAEANRYYNYVIAIMIAQFIFNGLLMFSWSRIYNENNALQEVHEDIAMAENTIIGNFFQHIASRLFAEADNIQRSIGNQSTSTSIEIEPRPQIAGFNNKTEKVEHSSNTGSNIGFKQQSNTSEKSSNTSSNTKERIVYKQLLKSDILGKLRTNDMLRYCLQKKADGKMELTEKEIRSQCNVKRWKYFEFQNLMISAGLINEPKKYINGKK